MKIKITEFAERHFDKDFIGTKILDFNVEDFEKETNNILYHFDILLKKLSETESNKYPDFDGVYSDKFIMDGYAPFCKLVAIKNFTGAKVGSLPITIENHQYIRSGYSARRDGEIPVFSRWLELPVEKPNAEWLILVLYDKEQIDKEAKIEYEKEFKPEPFDADWGIVAILGQSHSKEEPMSPETMIRNSYMSGGSGVEFDEDAYLKSVKFWEKNVTVK